MVRFVDPGEELAELDALAGNPFSMPMRHGFGLSPLDDVDSDRCSGIEALRWVPIPGIPGAEDAVAATCSSWEAVKLGNEYRSSAGAGYCCSGREREGEEWLMKGTSERGRQSLLIGG